LRYKNKANKNDKIVDRQLLYDHWASWKCLFKFQPINEIEHYFGTKVAFYFAWLGFYTTWLFPVALLGVLFFFFGFIDPSYEEGK
jgi:anoctamin-7